MKKIPPDPLKTFVKGRKMMPSGVGGFFDLATEILCTAEKVSVFGAKPVCSASRAA